MRVVLCYPAEQKHIDQIARIAGDAEIVDAGQELVARELPQADIFCGHPKVPVPWAEVVQRRQLRWIQSSAAGLDHCLVPEVIESDIVVTSASGVLADQVAEHTMGLLIATLRNFPVFFRAQQEKEFVRRPTADLHHRTVGIVGLGGVGRRLAELLAPLKTRIIATDWFPIDKPPHVDELRAAAELDWLLGESDIVVLCAPLTNVTRSMIDDVAIAKMRPGSVLINVARGPIVVERALADALTSGHLSAAAVDVTEHEPLDAGSELWELPNLIITPHVAGQSARRIDNMTNFFCDNLSKYLDGRPLHNLVEKRLGFPART
jgi:D-3-phosphoglycerate dehydrogenase